jgi:murein L,D-transpeptidase YafK
MRRGKIYLAFFVLAVIAASPAHSTQMALNQAPKVTINQLLPEEDAAPADLTHVKAASIQVIKSERRLDLLDKAGRTIRSYKVSLGFTPDGPKIKEGDGRTPEGRYYIDKRNEKSKFFRSLHISYPNPSDVQRARSIGARTGGSIFIHGKPNDKSWIWWRRAQKQDWTNGCIAVSDDEMKEIWNVVQDGTPIIIKP